MKNITLNEFLENPNFNKSIDHSKTELMKTLILLILGFYGTYQILHSVFTITKDPLTIIMLFMILTSLVIGISFKTIEIFRIINKRKNLKIEKELLQSIVQKAKLKDDYEDLNLLLLSHQGSSYILEICFFINKYHNGLWLNKDKLKYPKEWGEDFFELSSKFFKEEENRVKIENKAIKRINSNKKTNSNKISQLNNSIRKYNPIGGLINKAFQEDLNMKEKSLNYEDLSDFLVITTYLATVKKEVVSDIVQHFDNIKD